MRYEGIDYLKKQNSVINLETEKVILLKKKKKEREKVIKHKQKQRKNKNTKCRKGNKDEDKKIENIEKQNPRIYRSKAK